MSKIFRVASTLETHPTDLPAYPPSNELLHGRIFGTITYIRNKGNDWIRRNLEAMASHPRFQTLWTDLHNTHHFSLTVLSSALAANGLMGKPHYHTDVPLRHDVPITLGGDCFFALLTDSIPNERSHTTAMAPTEFLAGNYHLPAVHTPANLWDLMASQFPPMIEHGAMTPLSVHERELAVYDGFAIHRVTPARHPGHRLTIRAQFLPKNCPIHVINALIPAGSTSP